MKLPVSKSDIFNFSSLICSHGLVVFLFVILFSACRKSDRDTDTGTEMVSDNSYSAYFFNDLLYQVHQLALSDSSLNSGNIYLNPDTSCINTITRTNLAGYFPDTIIINFGTDNGGACSDGNLRRGKLKIVFSGKYGAASKICTVYPENYFLNDIKTEGKIMITGKGRNSSNNLYFSITAEGGVISNDSLRIQFFAPAQGKTIPLQSEWISGESTSLVSDDVFQLTGTHGGFASKGTGYSAEISTPLRIQSDCKWISGGIERIIPSNLSPREVDYGSGCDSKSSVKINGKSFEVTLLP